MNNDRIRSIYMEDKIWVIYIIIIFMSWYDNYLERNYLCYNDYKSKEEYRKILIYIFSILLIIYIYFFKSSYKDLVNIGECDDINKRKLTELACMGSLFIVISGIIFLYVAYMDYDAAVEVAFN